MLRATWEDVVTMIAGPRTGKTTTIAVPAVLDAPGAVYVTSNKRDLYDYTAAIRAKGGPVWLFDPQRIAGGLPTFWWNPLDLAVDVTGARTLAGLFASATRPVGSSSDSYFDPEGEEVLAMLLLAAASGARPITDVYRWLNPDAASDDHEPVQLLEGAGHRLAATGLRGVLALPERQRAGVIGTAKKMVGWLADPKLTAWITDPGDGRPRFTADRFLDDRSTFYSLSKEGPGSAGPLTAALTAAVLAGAELVAARSPRGRLPIPLVGVLDEVANVCRWRDLPDLVSHYGSRGIVLASFLQSWSQGVECWSREGMRKLWGASNVRVYGGGVADLDFLDDVSQLCGEYDAPTRSQSTRTITHSSRRERVFDVATLAALPAGRAVVMLSGAPPVLVELESCFAGRHAGAIRSALAVQP